MSERSARVALLILLVLGVGLRAWHLVDLQDDPLVRAPTLDALYHDHFARGLALGDWSLPEGVQDPAIRTTPLHRPVGAPLVYAAVYKVVSGPWGPRALQALLGLLLGLLTWRLSRRTFRDAPPLVHVAAVGFVWLSPTLIYFEGELQSVTFAALGVAAFVLVAVRASGQPSYLNFAAAGLVLGLLLLFRPNAAPLSLVMLLPAWRVFRGGEKLKPIGLLTCFALICGAVNAPVAIRNHRVSGEWVMTSTNGGISLAFANQADADGVESVVPRTQIFRGVEAVSPLSFERFKARVEQNVGRALGYRELDALLTREARQWMSQHPSAFIGLTLRRGLLLLGPREIANNRPVGVLMTKRASLRFAPAKFALVCALALASIAFVVRRRRRADDEPDDAPFMLLAAALLYIAPLALFYAGARLRAPVFPLLAVLGAYGGWQLLEALRGNDGRWRALIAVCVAVPIALIPWGAPEVHEERFHLERALAYQRLGDLERASASVAAAEQLAQNEAVAITRAYLELERGAPDQAEAAFRRALSVNESGPALAGLGAALAAQGRAAEARAPLERAVVVDDRNATAWYNLGLARFAAGDPVGAKAAYQRCLDVQPNNSRAQNNLARTLLALGEPQAALGYLDALLRQTPGERDVVFNRARALDALGRASEAEAAYGEILAAAPDDTGALTNLGVLTERTDPASALPLFARAHELNPTHPGLTGNHARALAKTGRVKDAVAILEGKSDPALRDQLARILVEVEPARALQLAQRLVDQTVGGHPQPLLTLSLALDKLGRTQEAEESKARATSLCAANPTLARFCDP